MRVLRCENQTFSPVFIQLSFDKDIKRIFLTIMGSELTPRALIIFLSVVSARAQDCSNIFRVYRGFDGLHAEITKSNNVLETTLRLEVIMSVAMSLNGVNLLISLFL